MLRLRWVGAEEAAEGGVVGAGAHLDQGGRGVEFLVPTRGVALDAAVCGRGLVDGAVRVVRVGRRPCAAGVGFGGEVRRGR